MRYIARFITLTAVLGTSFISVPPRAASALTLWTPPLSGNLNTGSEAACFVFLTGTTATKDTASVTVDLLKGNTGEVIATASASGPFSPGTQMAVAHINSAVGATICRITASNVPKKKLRAVLEMFNAITGVPAAAVPLVK